MNLRRDTNSGFTLPMLRERASTLPMPRERAFTLPMPRERASTLPAPRERAFTLVELMIAAAITVVIVLVLGGMFLSLMNTSMRASQRTDAFRDARAALQTIERDMANLVQLPSTLPTPTPTPPTSAAPSPLKSAAYFALDNVWQDPNDPSYSANTGSLNRQMFGLVATKNASSPTYGDLCAVGYYCRWDTNHYVLCRYFRDSATTVPAIQATGGPYVPVATLYAPSSIDEVLAAYVWNFNVTLYDGSGNKINAYDPTTGLIGIYPYICDPSTTTTNPLPAAIEISFNAMSPQAARTVMSVSSSPNDWMDTTTTNYQRLILPHMYQFRTRINLQ
jgi:type II secretory pathway pseudopilin PulG